MKKTVTSSPENTVFGFSLFMIRMRVEELLFAKDKVHVCISGSKNITLVIFIMLI